MPTLRVRVWDGVTRATHWSLVGLFAFSWWTAEQHEMEYHRYSGYLLLGVLMLRIFWGIAGSTTARFAYFVKGPEAVWHYMRAGRREGEVGHNPLGALSVLAMLALLVAQVGLGLFSVDIDGLESGPLSDWVDFDTGRLCAKLHHRVFSVLQLIIVIHLLAVAYHVFIKRDGLIRPMITGWKSVAATPREALRFAPPWRAVLGVALAATAVWFIVR